MGFTAAGAAIGAASAETIGATMFGSVLLGGAMAGASAGSMIGGYMGQKDARREQAEATRTMADERRIQAQNEAKRAEIQNVRAIRQQIRQQYAAAASIIGRGAVTGTLGSSGVQGGVASTVAQLAGNLNYSSNIADVNTAQTASSMRYGDANLAYGIASGNVAQAQAMGALGQTIFTNVGGWSTVFGKPTVSPNQVGGVK